MPPNSPLRPSLREPAAIDTAALPGSAPLPGTGRPADSGKSKTPVGPFLIADRERTFWTLQLVGWFGYACVRIFHGITIDWALNYLDTTAVAAVTGFVLSSLLRYFYRPLRNRALPLVVAATLFFCTIFALIFSAIEVTAGTYYDPDNLLDTGLFENAMFDGFILLAWSGVYFGLHYYEQLQRQREATLRAAARAHEAQLAMLRYQLNPHFLFNTLNAISTLVLAGQAKRADRMLGKLSAFLRTSLVHHPEEKVTLEQELKALALYLEIEQVRFADRLRTRFRIDERANRALIPSLLLQPLIENAVKYAIAPSENGGTIEVAARIEGRTLVLVVRDDGPGSAPEGVSSGSGVGLKNTAERLAEIYGEAHA
ncbi:MAG: hypothetical protein D6757_01375, partial [Alphaproteobacteria bacterium]